MKLNQLLLRNFKSNRIESGSHQNSKGFNNWIPLAISMFSLRPFSRKDLKLPGPNRSLLIVIGPDGMIFALDLVELLPYRRSGFCNLQSCEWDR